MLAILGAPGVTRRRLAQGLFGANSLKPTDPLVINMPHLPLELRKWMTRKGLPRGSAIGLDERGFWRTSGSAHATAIRNTLDGIRVFEAQPPLAQAIERWQSLNGTTYSDHLGTDLPSEFEPELRSLRTATMDRLGKNVYVYIYAYIYIYMLICVCVCICVCVRVCACAIIRSSG